MSQESSNITALSERRKERNRATRVSNMDQVDRISELEVDLLRITDLALELQETVSSQGRLLHKLLRLLKDHVRLDDVGV